MNRTFRSRWRSSLIGACTERTKKCLKTDKAKIGPFYTIADLRYDRQVGYFSVVQWGSRSLLAQQESGTKCTFGQAEQQWPEPFFILQMLILIQSELMEGSVGNNLHKS